MTSPRAFRARTSSRPTAGAVRDALHLVDEVGRVVAYWLQPVGGPGGDPVPGQSCGPAEGLLVVAERGMYLGPHGLAVLAAALERAAGDLDDREDPGGPGGRGTGCHASPRSGTHSERRRRTTRVL